MNWRVPYVEFESGRLESENCSRAELSLLRDRSLRRLPRAANADGPLRTGHAPTTRSTPKFRIEGSFRLTCSTALQRDRKSQNTTVSCHSEPLQGLRVALLERIALGFTGQVDVPFAPLFRWRERGPWTRDSRWRRETHLNRSSRYAAREAIALMRTFSSRAPRLVGVTSRR